MQVSVIIPVYNRRQTLPRALESVIAQLHPAAEIIVVDDGSEDGTAQMVRQQYPDVQLIEQPNKGVSAARNAGIRAAKYGWIALLDSDDEWLPQKLSRILQAHEKQPDLLLWHSDEIWVRNGTRVNPMNKHAKQGGNIFKHCLPLCVISPSAAVIHRKVFSEIGWFDEALPACEDYDYWLRFCHRYEVGYIEQPLIRKYGGHADQLSRKHWGMDRFRIHALDKLLQQKTITPTQRELACQMLIKKTGILLKGARKHQNQSIIEQFEPLLQQYGNSSC